MRIFNSKQFQTLASVAACSYLLVKIIAQFTLGKQMEENGASLIYLFVFLGLYYMRDSEPYDQGFNHYPPKSIEF